MADFSVNPKITSLSRWGEWICYFAIAALIASGIYALQPDILPKLLAQQLPPNEALDQPSLSWIYVAGAIHAIPALLTAAALWCASRLFASLRVVDFFSARSQSLLTKTAWLAFATALADFIAQIFIANIMTMGSPPHSITLSIGINTAQVLGVIIGLLLLIFALLLRETAAVAEENRSII